MSEGVPPTVQELAQQALDAPDDNNFIAHVEALRAALRRRGPLARLQDHLNDPLRDAALLERIAAADRDGLREIVEAHPKLIDPDALAVPKVTRTWSTDRAPPDREWLIPSWLAAHRVALLTGRASRGKSWLVAHLAAAVAARRQKWIDDTQHPNVNGGVSKVPQIEETAFGHVVIATWEDEAEELDRRLYAVGPAGLDDRLHHLDMSAHGPLWNHEGLTPIGEWLRSYCDRPEVKMLVVDPLSGAFAGDEIQRASVRRFMSNWDAWARETNTTIVMVGHPSKADNDSLDGAYSGSTDWLAAPRGLLFLNAHAPDQGDIGDDRPDRIYTLKCVKVSYGPRPEPIYLQRAPSGKWKACAPPPAAPKSRQGKRAQNGDTDAAVPAEDPDVG